MLDVDVDFGDVGSFGREMIFSKGFCGLEALFGRGWMFSLLLDSMWMNLDIRQGSW